MHIRYQCKWSKVLAVLLTSTCLQAAKNQFFVGQYSFMDVMHKHNMADALSALGAKKTSSLRSSDAISFAMACAATAGITATFVYNYDLINKAKDFFTQESFPQQLLRTVKACDRLHDVTVSCQPLPSDGQLKPILTCMNRATRQTSLTISTNMPTVYKEKVAACVSNILAKNVSGNFVITDAVRFAGDVKSPKEVFSGIDGINTMPTAINFDTLFRSKNFKYVVYKRITEQVDNLLLSTLSYKTMFFVYNDAFLGEVQIIKCGGGFKNSIRVQFPRAWRLDNVEYNCDECFPGELPGTWLQKKRELSASITVKSSSAASSSQSTGMHHTDGDPRMDKCIERTSANYTGHYDQAYARYATTSSIAASSTT